MNKLIVVFDIICCGSCYWWCNLQDVYSFAEYSVFCDRKTLDFLLSDCFFTGF